MLVLLAESLSAQSVAFRGRVVMASGGPPFRQITVRVDRFGVATPNDGGFFTVAIPANVRTVTVQVETGSARWALRYPVAAVPVPRDPEAITDLLVGPSIDETLSREFAASMARLSSGLRRGGAADTQVVAAINLLRQEFAQRTNLRVDELQAAERLSDERARVFPTLSATIEGFVIKADNIAIAFRYLLESSFSNDSAFAQLQRSILEYNTAYEALKTNRNGFELGVTRNWQNPRISADLRALLDFALGDVHAIQVLPLNDVLPDVSRILTRQVSGREAESKRAEILARVRGTTSALMLRLEELERRKTRVIEALQST
jgi:hypothetical protein